MAETSAFSKLAGNVAHLVAIAGLAAFFFGLFGWGKGIMIAGIGLIVVSLGRVLHRRARPAKTKLNDR